MLSYIKSPPVDNHLYTWRQWLNAAVKKDITKNLEAMQHQGIRGAALFNINLFNWFFGR